jgi:prolyl 4-hydroxylase
VKLDKIDLDTNGEVHLGLIREMREILQWWCKMKLRHTSTFGLRIYRRDSMLINHLDIEYTHLASAVIQVGQEVDQNGGWPLEVMDSDNSGLSEVYLQPGELVLYEGARLKHGRPMRLRGKEFGNIFSHFAPSNWKGRHTEYEHEHFKDEL